MNFFKRLLFKTRRTRQKFMPLEFVHVAAKLPMPMRHFRSDLDAIVLGTYSQLHGGENITDYHLYLIEQPGRVTDSVAWYPESALTRCEVQDPVKAAEMIEVFNLRKECPLCEAGVPTREQLIAEDISRRVIVNLAGVERQTLLRLTITPQDKEAYINERMLCPNCGQADSWAEVFNNTPTLECVCRLRINFTPVIGRAEIVNDPTPHTGTPEFMEFAAKRKEQHECG